MAETGLIRTPDQRVRVFVSSALQELAAERRAVRDAITDLRLVPVMFELGARPHPPRNVYRAYLAQSQVFVGIYWQSYGWAAPGERMSGLEDEYVLSAGMPRLIYVKSPHRTGAAAGRMLNRIKDSVMSPTASRIRRAGGLGERPSRLLMSASSGHASVPGVRALRRTLWRGDTLGGQAGGWGR
jgi:hypothetical protein